jgi:putative sigma-54 modulation protein
MEIAIQTSHVRPNEKLINFIEGKVKKLEKIFRGAIKAKIFLKTENAHKSQNKTVEIIIHSAGKDIFASTRSEKFEIAVSKSVNALKNQIRKTKS